MKVLLVPCEQAITVVDVERVCILTECEIPALKKRFPVDSSFSSKEKKDREEIIQRIMREAQHGTFERAKSIIWLKRDETVPSTCENTYLLCDWPLPKLLEEYRLALNPNLVKRKRAFFEGMSAKDSEIKSIEEVERQITVKRYLITMKDGKEILLNSKPHIEEVIENKDE